MSENFYGTNVPILHVETDTALLQDLIDSPDSPVNQETLDTLNRYAERTCHEDINSFSSRRRQLDRTYSDPTYSRKQAAAQFYKTLGWYDKTHVMNRGFTTSAHGLNNVPNTIAVSRLLHDVVSDDLLSVLSRAYPVLRSKPETVAAMIAKIETVTPDVGRILVNHARILVTDLSRGSIEDRAGKTLERIDSAPLPDTETVRTNPNKATSLHIPESVLQRISELADVMEQPVGTLSAALAQSGNANSTHIESAIRVAEAYYEENDKPLPLRKLIALGI